MFQKMLQGGGGSSEISVVHDSINNGVIGQQVNIILGRKPKGCIIWYPANNVNGIYVLKYDAETKTFNTDHTLDVHNLDVTNYFLQYIKETDEGIIFTLDGNFTFVEWVIW